MMVTREKLFYIDCQGWTDDDTGIAKFEFFSKCHISSLQHKTIVYHTILC